MCLFCDIADHTFTGAHIVDETEKTITFLDINPANEGHVLIIPKMHVDSLIDLPDDYVLEIVAGAGMVIYAYSSVYSAPVFCVMQNGGANCEFGHFHFHVFPRLPEDGYDWVYPSGEKEVSERVAQKLRGVMS